MAATEARVPEVIERYFAAHDRRDTEGALAAFSPDAQVHDDGHLYVGRDDIRDWLARASTQFTYTRTPTTTARLDDCDWDIGNRLEGDFPGGVVDLRYRFTINGDLISRLVIAP